MKPRILLVEDDPTTAAFMTAAIEALPATVDVAGSRADALAKAADVRHALWLFDAHLPDGDGAGLLAELRALGLATPAIAHTAAHDPWLHHELRAAGFASVLVKPLAASALRASLATAIGAWHPSRVAEDVAEVAGDAVDPPPRWDDAAALRALNGERAHVDALRVLFLDELPAAREGVVASALDGDERRMRDALHRLRASCGFVGAARLGDAVAVLEGAPGSAAALQAFKDAAQELLPPP
ncbi:response regulator [Luteimonas sp. MC1825]|uniref:response regulator n=1 Tax=Luteimonas sp. MC1825 TaxID=2761107 RepID=UPI00161986C5|nr:response regulator [Luteimonas sp. MC1825]MBB6599728.1 response regulator [Luteimonas sp. MC1825]QOC87409.1 response regulator [Luteimonas sp. MC1825]